MSELPISSKYRSTPERPVDDMERDQLTGRLNDAYAAGELDTTDYQGRMDRLYAADTLGELVPVVQGLPPVQTHNNPSIVAQGSGEPGELAPTRDARRFALVVAGGIGASILVLVVLIALILIF